MRKIKISQGKYTLVDNADFEEMNKLRWSLSTQGYVVHNINTGKRKTSKDGLLLLHRVLIKPKKGQIVDHINGNRIDNRRKNLRIATQSQNSMNKGPNKNNTSGFKGVFKSHNKYKPWRAMVVKDRKQIALGHFLTKEEAAQAYNKGATKHFGTFAWLNFIPLVEERCKDL